MASPFLCVPSKGPRQAGAQGHSHRVRKPCSDLAEPRPLVVLVKARKGAPGSQKLLYLWLLEKAKGSSFPLP